MERRGRGRAADRHHRAALAAISRDARAYPVRPVSKRRDPNPTFDLFIPLMNDLPLKDQREVMERPFFSLQKRKRPKPIEYRSTDGEAWVKVEAMPAYGMATIWDAEILIWAASVLNRMKEQEVNALPRTLTTTPYDMLRTTRRGTRGRDSTTEEVG